MLINDESSKLLRSRFVCSGEVDSATLRALTSAFSSASPTAREKKAKRQRPSWKKRIGSRLASAIGAAASQGRRKTRKVRLTQLVSSCGARLTWAMALFPSLLHFAGNLARGKHVRAFEEAAADPEGAQRARLAEILERNRGTEYAGAHFANVRTAEAYQRAPLLTPAGLQPWVKREMEGARNLLTADAPVYYVRTTGSTGEPKHIPITHSYRDEFQRTVHVSLWHLRQRFPAAFHSRALYFVGSRRVARAADGNDVGTMSGFNFTQMPALVRAIYAWPYELFEVRDLRARSFLALLCATLGDPSIIAGIFPAPIVYLLRDLEAQAEPLARCLREGKLPALDLPSAQRDFFQRALGGPRPSLARRVESGRSWPSLRLVYCWTGATAGLYVPELKRRLGPDVAVRDAIYSACEGWCSIPMGEEEPGGALALTSHFFEFLEEAADAALGDASFDYGRLRAGGQLAPLVLKHLEAGTYARVRQAKVEDGSAEAQLKTAHLVADAGALPPELRAALKT